MPSAQFDLLKRNVSLPKTSVAFAEHMLPHDAVTQVSRQNSAYQARVGGLRGGPELMAAAGFLEELVDGRGDWLCLEGTARALKKGAAKALQPALLESLEQRRTEIEAEVKAHPPPIVVCVLASNHQAMKGQPLGPSSLPCLCVRLA